MAKKIPVLSDNWLVLVNPHAGTNKGKRDWGRIEELLDQSSLSYETIFTKHKEHAIAITTKFIKKGYRKFIVAGGDGTLNEVVNGIFFQKNVPTEDFLIAMIPVGTGNDWCRMFNIPFDYKKAIKVIETGNSFLQDIGKVNYQNSNSPKRRYFINVAGMGYDAVVAAKTNKDKEHGRGGVLTYLKNLFTSLLFYKYTETEILIDDLAAAKGKTFSISVGICKYNGGGMMQLPEAIANDGIFDMTLIKKLGKLTVLKQVKNLYDGSFTNHPKVKTFKGRKIEIKSKPSINLEVDGESLGQSPFTFEILQESLRIVTAVEKQA